MKHPLMIGSILVCLAGGLSAADTGKAVQIFDGSSFRGWLGDTNKTWRIEDGAFIGGSLQANVPRNEFLCTTRSYTNFVLKLQFKLVGKSGFINAGVQVRSQPATNPPNEMVGYQCDIGEGYWGALYDETRRNKILAKPDDAAMKQALKKDDWNEYLIRCDGRRIQTWLNGVAMVDYTEPDEKIPQFGVIGLQIHGGAVAEVRYRQITVEELP